MKDETFGINDHTSERLFACRGIASGGFCAVGASGPGVGGKYAMEAHVNYASRGILKETTAKSKSQLGEMRAPQTRTYTYTFLRTRAHSSAVDPRRGSAPVSPPPPPSLFLRRFSFSQSI